jgi:hypothetical protein
MLVILSCAETFKKTNLSAIIHSTLNNLVSNELTLDCFYRNRLDLAEQFNYRMLFRALPFDFGVESQVRFPEGGIYTRFLDNYHNRSHPYHVICGSFSKVFCDMARQDIADTEVINITRHPSTTYILDTIAHDPLAPYNTNMGLKLFKKRFNSSILQQINLKNHVKTIKFEDMIRNQSIEVFGQSIDLTPFYKPYNKWLTVKEYTESIPQYKLTSEDLDKFNQAYMQFNQTWPKGRDDMIAEIIPKLPQNVFNELDYSSLTYEEIINDNDTQY